MAAMATRRMTDPPTMARPRNAGNLRPTARRRGNELPLLASDRGGEAAAGGAGARGGAGAQMRSPFPVLTGAGSPRRRAHPGDAGCDLFAAESARLEPG